MSSKLDKADAQEWLESLQQVGEGWWRQVALAVRAGAHKALGMERREFAQAIGQRMIDPREAVVELHREGHTKRAIADVLGISEERTHNLLVEEGVIEGEVRPTGSHGRKALRAAAGSDAQENDPDAGSDSAKLLAEIDNLTAQVKGEQKKRKDDAKAAREKLADLRKLVTEEKRKAKQSAEEALTKAERERLGKEAEAWAEEQGRKVLVGFSHLIVESIVGALEEAAGEVRLLIEQDAWTDKSIAQVESARAGFDEEFNVARMSAATGGGA